jgi:hypothetical protein
MADDKKRLNAQLGEDIHRRFKMACLLKGEKMSDVLRDLIEGYIERAGLPKSLLQPKPKRKRT